MSTNEIYIYPIADYIVKHSRVISRGLFPAYDVL